MVTGIGGTPGYGPEYSRSGGPEQQQEIQDAYNAFREYTESWLRHIETLGIPMQDYENLVEKLEKIRDDSKMPPEFSIMAMHLLGQLEDGSTAYPNGIPGSPLKMPTVEIDKGAMFSIVDELGEMKV